EFSLRDLEISPGGSGKQRGVLAPDTGRTVLVRDVGILTALGLDEIGLAVTCRGYEVRLIVTQVGRRIGVLNDKAELLRQLGERLYVGRVLEKTGEPALELVFAGDEVEDG